MNFGKETVPSRFFKSSNSFDFIDESDKII